MSLCKIFVRLLNYVLKRLNWNLFLSLLVFKKWWFDGKVFYCNKYLVYSCILKIWF